MLSAIYNILNIVYNKHLNMISCIFINIIYIKCAISIYSYIDNINAREAREKEQKKCELEWLDSNVDGKSNTFANKWISI